MRIGYYGLCLGFTICKLHSFTIMERIQVGQLRSECCRTLIIVLRTCIIVDML